MLWLVKSLEKYLKTTQSIKDVRVKYTLCILKKLINEKHIYEYKCFTNVRILKN